MNKSNLTNWLSALCAILLIISLAVQSKQKTQIDSLRQQHETFMATTDLRQREAGEAVVKLADQLTTLSTNLEYHLTQNASQTVGRTEEAHDDVTKLSAQLTNLQTNLEYRLAQRDQHAKETMSETTSAIQQQQKEEHTIRETNFREMRQQLDSLVSSGALFPNKSKPAGEAVALAKAAEKAGDINLAKIYYLSAINHAPSELSILNDYAELVFHDSSTTTEDFARLKSVLQISLYQIPPAGITNALGLLDETIRHEDKLLAAQSPKLAPVNWQDRFEQLIKTNTLEDSWTNLSRISERWSDLNEIAESLHEEQPGSDLTIHIESELDLTQRVLAAMRLATGLDRVMEALDSSSNQPQKAVSLLQTAEATLGSLWGIDSKRWPAALRSKIDQYPTTIQNHVETITEVKSRPFLEKVEAARASAKAYLNSESWKTGNEGIGPRQRLLNHYDGCISNTTIAYQSISSVEMRKTSEAAIKEIRDLVIESKRIQFDEYQKKVVEYCQKAFKQYADENFTLSPKRITDPTKANTLARRIFTESCLAQIDESMLTPETNRLFNDVLGKLTAKMDGEGQFQTAKEIAEKTKMKMEDF